MQTWKLISGAALLFILGILVGLLLGHHMRGYRPLPPWEQGPKARSGAILERLSKDLRLTEDQKVLVGRIIGETEEKVEKQFMQMEPQVRGLIEESLDRIEKELDATQKERLRAFRKKMEERMERHKRGSTWKR